MDKEKDHKMWSFSLCRVYFQFEDEEIDLSHGLRAQEDILIPLLVTPVPQRSEALPRGGQGRLAGPFLDRPGMDHHPVRPHPPGHPAGGQDIPCGLGLAVRFGIGRVDKVGCVEGEGNPRLSSGLPNGPGSGLPHRDPFSALVLIGVQSPLPQPAGHLLGLFLSRGIKPLRVAGGAKPRPHSPDPFPAPARKGVSKP